MPYCTVTSPVAEMSTREGLSLASRAGLAKREESVICIPSVPSIFGAMGWGLFLSAPWLTLASRPSTDRPPLRCASGQAQGGQAGRLGVCLSHHAGIGVEPVESQAGHRSNSISTPLVCHWRSSWDHGGGGRPLRGCEKNSVTRERSSPDLSKKQRLTATIPDCR
jgi:hypothetical protein